MQLFQTISRKSLSIWLSLLCMLSLWSSFSLSASAEDTIPFPIAWQQSEGSGAEEQRLAYLPEVDNWCDYPWNRGTETGNTVGQAGCSLLSIVNAVYYRTGTFLHPAELAQFALDNGYRIPGVDGAAMGFFPAVAQAAEESHMTFAGWTTQAATVLAHLRNGGTASANIAGHWIALVDYDVTTDQYLMLIPRRFPVELNTLNGQTGKMALPGSPKRSCWKTAETATMASTTAILLFIRLMTPTPSAMSIKMV